MLPSDLASSRMSQWMIGTLVVLMLLSVQACWRLRRSQLAASTAQSNWQVCHRLAEEIAELRQQPALATLDSQPPQELSKSVTVAVADAGLPSDVVRSIDPQAASRIANTSYERQSTQIDLQRMEMPVLVSVIQSVVTRQTGLHATSIELKASSGAGVGEQSWDVGLTLTRLIYTP